jgi:hypothetical protein
METSTQIMIDTATKYLLNINRTLDRVEYKKGKVLFAYSGDHVYLMDFSTDKLNVIKVEIN